MVNVSKNPLQDTSFEELYKQLAKLVGKSSSSNADKLMTEILTKTEKVMLAKRIAAILMIRESVSQTVIINTLKLSKTTVRELEHRYISGAFKTVERLAGRTKKEREELWRTIESVVSLGMPSMAGSDRWRMFDRGRKQAFPRKR